MYLKTVTRTTPTKGTPQLKALYVSKDCHKYNTNKVYFKVKEPYVSKDCHKYNTNKGYVKVKRAVCI